MAGAWLWLPSTRFGAISVDAPFSAFYGINTGVQYRDPDAAPSPLQHFWSLAVEEHLRRARPVEEAFVEPGCRAAVAAAARPGAPR